MNEILFNKVMNRIDDERARMQAIRRFIIASIIFGLSMISSVFVWNAFAGELINSGFSQYISLIFSDLRAVLANWQDFGMSLLESFPVLNAAELLGTIIALMLSARFIVVSGRRLALFKHAGSVNRV